MGDTAEQMVRAKRIAQLESEKAAWARSAHEVGARNAALTAEVSALRASRDTAITERDEARTRAALAEKAEAFAEEEVARLTNSLDEARERLAELREAVEGHRAAIKAQHGLVGEGPITNGEWSSRTTAVLTAYDRVTAALTAAPTSLRARHLREAAEKVNEAVRGRDGWVSLERADLAAAWLRALADEE